MSDFALYLGFPIINLEQGVIDPGEGRLDVVSRGIQLEVLEGDGRWATLSVRIPPKFAVMFNPAVTVTTSSLTEKFSPRMNVSFPPSTDVTLSSVTVVELIPPITVLLVPQIVVATATSLVGLPYSTELLLLTSVHT